MTDFQEKIVLILIQYLAIALIVAYAGYLFSKSLERFKARQALEGAIAKQRVDMIAACWSAIYTWEATVRDFMQKAASLQLQHGNDPTAFQAAAHTELAPVETRSKDQMATAKNTVESSRFWLGEELYVGFREYSNRMVDYMNAFVAGNLEQFKTIEEQIEKAKIDVSKILELQSR